MRKKIWIILLLGVFFTGLIFTLLFIVNKKPKSLSFGVIDLNRNILVEPKYQKIGFYSEGLASVNCGKNKKKIGFIDNKGEFLIPPIYEYAGGFREGLACVGKDNKLGFIDQKAKVVIPFKYDGASCFVNGFAAVRNNGKIGYINKKGILVIGHEYDNFSFLSDGLINVEKDKKWGYIDSAGNIVIDFIFDEGFPFYDEIAYVGINNKYGYIDKKNNVLIPLTLDFTEEFEYRDVDTGILDLEVNYLIYANDITGLYSPSFLLLNRIRKRDKLILFKENDKYGFMNLEGEIKISPQYLTATSFYNGRSLVKKENVYFLIDTEGEIIKTFKDLSSIKFLNKNLLSYSNLSSEKYGLININDPSDKFNEYDKIIPVKDGYSAILLDNRWGLIDPSGNELIKPLYTSPPFISEKNIVIGIESKKSRVFPAKIFRDE